MTTEVMGRAIDRNGAVAACPGGLDDAGAAGAAMVAICGAADPQDSQCSRRQGPAKPSSKAAMLLNP
ncbi:MAG: hypothetical protein ACYDC5_12510 [Candidatus Dormibacteria bacterium]